jgi:hypothetical protein
MTGESGALIAVQPLKAVRAREAQADMQSRNS